MGAVGFDKFEIAVINWLEKKVIDQYFSGAQKYMVLFALPFKAKQFEDMLVLNLKSVAGIGMVSEDGKEVNLDLLEKHAVTTMDKCGTVPVDFGFKTINFDVSDVKDLFQYIRTALCSN